MLRNHKSVLRKVADKRVTASAKKRLIIQRGGILLPLLSAVLPTITNLLFRKRAKSVFPIARQATCQFNMLREMYLVSSDKFPLAETTLSDGKTEKKKKSENSPLKKMQHPYDKWAGFLEKNP